MIFHENRLLSDDSHVVSNLIFVENWERSQYLSSAAVEIGALRVKFIENFERESAIDHSCEVW